jgi:predicted kinase
MSHADLSGPIAVDDPSLVVLIGAAGSGKSTLASMLWPGCTLSSDKFREMVCGDPHDQDATAEAFHVLYQLVSFRLRRRLTTAVDSTAATPYARGALLELARAYDVPAVAVVVHPPLARVLYRNNLRPRPVPEDAVRRQHLMVTEALDGLAGEGFERVILAGPDGWPREGGH